MEYTNIINAIATTPWAIRPEKLEEIAEFIRIKANGGELPEFEAADRVETRSGGGVAVLPLYGTITQRANLIQKYSGGTPTEQFSKMLRAALSDPDVGSIVIDIDSPGGSVYGVPELAGEIYNSRNRKRIVAVANSEAASAAYWLGSQADELIVTPGGQVGSIGVVALHEDFTKALESKGIKVSMITAGKFKGEMYPFRPLGEDTRAYMQSRVDDYYDVFVKAVARGRGASQKAVREGFGEGRMVGAIQALKMGMADDIATLDEVISGMASGKKRKKRYEAEETGGTVEAAGETEEGVSAGGVLDSKTEPVKLRSRERRFQRLEHF